MATQIITATLKSVRKQSDGKYIFRVTPTGLGGGSYRFLLSKEKAMKIVNQDAAFPLGVELRLRGTTKDGTTKDYGRVPPEKGLKFVKILAVDGHDVQSWAEKNQSPTVAPDVLAKAQGAINEAEEEKMRRRAPPEPPPRFATPLEAFETAMQRLRRQVRLKEPKLSKTDIWTIRDALNMLKEAAGL